jgi:hypothetical protein
MSFSKELQLGQQRDWQVGSDLITASRGQDYLVASVQPDFKAGPSRREEPERRAVCSGELDTFRGQPGSALACG